MGQIIDFFSQLGSVISDIVDFIIDAVTGLVKALGIMSDSQDTLLQSVEYLPDVLKSYALITITLITILFIINRQGGKTGD